MKKILALLIALVLMFSAVSVAHVSAAASTFNGKTVSVGDTVTYSYYLKTPMKVVNTDFVINYTGATLKLVDADNRTRFPIVYNGSMFNTNLENQIKATCSNISTMYDFTSGGFLFTISFVVTGEGESTASVTIPFLKGVNPQGISQPEVFLIRNNNVVYDGVTVEENSVVASGCDHKFTETTTSATCTKNGTTVKTCTLCGYTETETIPATGHSWGEWKVTRPATEQQEGEETRTCLKDNATETREIPKLEPILGDVDGDRKLTSNDALLVQKFTINLIPASEFPKDKADMNSDGTVNIKDATVIQKKVVGLI